MTLREWLCSKGYAYGSARKCRCPFHCDQSPSAYVNPNSIYCFAEQRSYGLGDFYRRFGVWLERDTEESGFLGSLYGEELDPPHSVLFTYRWHDDAE